MGATDIADGGHWLDDRVALNDNDSDAEGDFAPDNDVEEDNEDGHLGEAEGDDQGAGG